MTSKTTTKQTSKAASEKTEKAATETVKAASKAAEKVNAETRKNMEQGVEKVRNGVETATTFGQGNIEAVVTSSTIAAKAFENVTSEMTAYSKKSLEDNMAAAKELSSCRSVTELMEKQAEFSRVSIESFVAEASKLNEMYAAAAQEALAPLGKRVTAAVEMVKGYRF